MIRILSFGGGIQTAYMLYKYHDRYDFVVWADVSNGTEFDEKAKTYWFIKQHVKPFCQSLDLPFVTVYPKKSLFEHCMFEKIIPTTHFRWCTNRFKIQPIQRFVRELGATKENPIHQDIGFSYDEFARSEGRKREVKYLISEYPLVDNKITRDMCKAYLIQRLGFLPPKSGCVYCPFASKDQFREVAHNDDKSKVPKIVELEKNNRRYPNITLKMKYIHVAGRKKGKLVGIPIEKILVSDTDTLDGYMMNEESTCVSGNCFV